MNWSEEPIVMEDRVRLVIRLHDILERQVRSRVVYRMDAKEEYLNDHNQDNELLHVGADDLQLLGEIISCDVH
jgi:hypothetical protein